MSTGDDPLTEIRLVQVMSRTMTTVIARIDERLKVVALSRRAASVKAGLGPDYIRDLARKKVDSPTLSAIERLAPVLETTVEWLRSGNDQKTLNVGDFKPPQPIFGSDDLPLYRSAEAGSGYIVVTSEPYEFISRPTKLIGNSEAFAVVVAGESMSPEYEPGDQLLVDPWRPLVRDRNFIFIDDRNGDWSACVKRLLKWDDESFFVRQHNPNKGQERDFVLARAEWPKAFRVLGKYDRD